MRGRPPKWQDCIDPAWEYVNGGFQTEGDVFPSVAGLAVSLGCSRESIHAWSREHQDFSDIVRTLMAKQERMLKNGGILGEYNASITKLMLTKHGFSDKVESAHTGADGGPIEIKQVERKIVDPSN